MDSLAVDQCTGNVFISRPATGEILELVRLTGELRVFRMLREPTRLLALYRAGVSCPDSFQLLVVDADAAEISIFLPAQEIGTVWLGAVQGRDLSFLPPGTEFSFSEAVVLSEDLESLSPQQLTGSQVSLVNLPDL